MPFFRSWLCSSRAKKSKYQDIMPIKTPIKMRHIPPELTMDEKMIWYHCQDVYLKKHLVTRGYKILINYFQTSTHWAFLERVVLTLGSYIKHSIPSNKMFRAKTTLFRILSDRFFKDPDNRKLGVIVSLGKAIPCMLRPISGFTD